VRFLDVIQGLRNLAIRDGRVSLARAAQLERGEFLIQKLRQRFIDELLAGDEDLEAEDALVCLIEDKD
jgi:hypothetical protein